MFEITISVLILDEIKPQGSCFALFRAIWLARVCKRETFLERNSIRLSLIGSTWQLMQDCILTFSAHCSSSRKIRYVKFAEVKRGIFACENAQNPKVSINWKISQGCRSKVVKISKFDRDQIGILAYIFVSVENINWQSTLLGEQRC